MSSDASFAARRSYFALSLVVLLADQATKILAHELLRERAAVQIIPGFFNLDYSANRGGLFGYFAGLADPWRVLLLTVLPLLAIVMVTLFIMRGRDMDRPTLLGLALILGGAVGNLIDRLARGEVVDFLDVYAGSGRLADWLIANVGTERWPTFNLADSAIVVGAFLLAFSIVQPGQPAQGPRPADDPPPEAR